MANFFSKIAKAFQDQRESSAQLRLRFEMHATPDVMTPAGNIDLLSSSTLVEIASCQEWKEAIGRLLVYSKYYPDRHKELHLTGSVNREALKIIQSHCDELRISLVVNVEEV